MTPVKARLANKFRRESGAGLARKERTHQKREATKMEEGEPEPLTQFQHKEQMRAEAEASRLEIIRLRQLHEEHAKLCRNAP